MSCEVNPKWINSLNSCNPNLSNSSLIKYSTAFTSWLVMLSMSLILWASLSLKFVYKSLNSENLLLGK